MEPMASKRNREALYIHTGAGMADGRFFAQEMPGSMTVISVTRSTFDGGGQYETT